MYSVPQKLFAEFLGTFALIFFGAGAVCTDQYLHGAGGVGLLGIALAHGLAIGIMVSALGHISGGHFNPAVTIGFWVTKRVNTVDVLIYWAAQLAGAAAAAFLLKALVPEETWRAVALGTPALVRDFSRLSGMVLEAARKWDIDLGRSLMIGDALVDRELAEACGMRFVGVEEGIVTEVRASSVHNWDQQ